MGVCRHTGRISALCSRPTIFLLAIFLIPRPCEFSVIGPAGGGGRGPSHVQETSYTHTNTKHVVLLSSPWEESMLDLEVECHILCSFVNRCHLLLSCPLSLACILARGLQYNTWKCTGNWAKTSSPYAFVSICGWEQILHWLKATWLISRTPCGDFGNGTISQVWTSSGLPPLSPAPHHCQASV